MGRRQDADAQSLTMTTATAKELAGLTKSMYTAVIGRTATGAWGLEGGLSFGFVGAGRALPFSK